MKQLGEGWNWRDLKVGDKFITYGRTIFEADLLNFVTLCGFSEELFTNREYIKEHAPMRGGHPVPGALVYSMAEGLVIPTTLQGTGLAFLSMGLRHQGADLRERHAPRRDRGHRDQADLQGSDAGAGADHQSGEEPEGRHGADLHAAAHDARKLTSDADADRRRDSALP
jgi:hypothetical protein